MAVYDVSFGEEVNQVTLNEQHIYGASRLGMIKSDQLVYDNGNEIPVAGDIVNNLVGWRRYEMTNHLGNVQATITDRKLYNTTDLLYEAVVMMTSDYYPFGMQMPDRHTEVESYRYAYNGMEQDNEVSGNGNSYTTEFRQYDPRLGRWKSLDPLMGMFPDMSPYVAFDNNPIFFVDPYGLSATNGGGPPDNANLNDTWVNDENGKSYTYTEGGWLDDEIIDLGEVVVSPRGGGTYNDQFRKHRAGDIDNSTWYNRYSRYGWVKHDGLASGNNGHKVRGKAKVLDMRRGDFGLTAYPFYFVFKDGGVAEDLLHHYGSGLGEPMELTESQIKEVFPNAANVEGDPLDLSLSSYAMKSLGPVTTGLLTAYANSDGTLGEFTISMSGERRLEDVGSNTLNSVTSKQIVFRGVVTLLDTYDFKKTEEGEEPRTASSAFQTWVGRHFIIGDDFIVNGSIGVMQVGNGPLTDLKGNKLHGRKIQRKTFIE